MSAERIGLSGNSFAINAAIAEADQATAAILDALLAVAFELRTANLLAYRVGMDTVAPDRIDERLGL